MALNRGVIKYIIYPIFTEVKVSKYLYEKGRPEHVKTLYNIRSVMKGPFEFEYLQGLLGLKTHFNYPCE